MSRTETELVKALAREVLAHAMIAQYEPRPMTLGFWPPGFVPPNVR